MNLRKKKIRKSIFFASQLAITITTQHTKCIISKKDKLL